MNGLNRLNKLSTFIIAEAGVNHNGSQESALELVDCAAKAGADCVKFQTFQADKLATKNTEKAAYQKANMGTSESQWEMLKKLELSESAHWAVSERCQKRGIEFLSSPFDEDSVDFLQSMAVVRFKIPSGEITNAPYLIKIARTGKPVIMSTGMATLGDVELALGALAFGYTRDKNETASVEAFKACLSTAYDILKEHVTLLHCTSQYPAPPETINLRAMETLRSCFGLPVGLSDHSEGYAIAGAAVALGATVIEKHFTLDRNLPGPDHKASLDPLQLCEMVNSIRKIELALGNGMKSPSPGELDTARVARKVVVAARPIGKGEPFLETNLTVKRAGKGLSPMYYWQLLGKLAPRDYALEEAIQEDDYLGQALEKHPSHA